MTINLSSRYMLPFAVVLIALVVIAGSFAQSNNQVPTWDQANNRWTYATPSSGSLPSGIIIGVLSAQCPSGFSEATELAGRTPLGTTIAAGDVGTTGGNDNITPVGTVSQPTFTGNAFSDVINHTHSINVTDPGHTHLTQRYPTATGGSSGFTIDTSMSGTLADNTLPTKTATTGITASSANPAGGVASITPTGTVSQPTFTGTQFDNRSAFVRVIWCRKD